ALLAGTGVSTYFGIEASRRAEEVETTLAGNLFRPVGHEQTPSPFELESLGELARLPNGNVRLRFLEAGVATGETAERLGRRAELAVHAAVGLDRGRRNKVLQSLLPRLRDDGIDPRIRVACAQVSGALRPDDPDGVRDAVRVVCEQMAKNNDPAA